MLKIDSAFVRLQYCLLISVLDLFAAASTSDDFSVIDTFTKRYCVSCHQPGRAKAGLDLTTYRKVEQIAASHREWQIIGEFIRSGEMPPSGAQAQPDKQERQRVLASLDAVLSRVARLHAGDPGVVLARRLSRREYDYSIHDLTGAPIRATDALPPDPAGGEGFDNTGLALTMSTGLLDKFIDTAQKVAEHLILTPDGIVFSTNSAKTYTGRRELFEKRIIALYRKHTPAFSTYLQYAKRYHHRGAEQGQLTPAQFALRHGLSAQYMTHLSETLAASPQWIGPLAEVGRAWQAYAGSRSRPGEDGKLLGQLIKSIRRHQERLCLEDSLRDEIFADQKNYPIEHLAMRKYKAVRRDRYLGDTGKRSIALNMGSLLAVTGHGGKKKKPKGKKKTKTLQAGKSAGSGVQRARFTLRFDDAGDGDDGDLVLVRPVLAAGTGDLASWTESRSLADLLKEVDPEQYRRLKFGHHPGGGSLADDTLVIQAPAELTITLPLAKLDGKRYAGHRLLAHCSIDRLAGAEGSVRVYVGRSRRRHHLLLCPDTDKAKRYRRQWQQFCATFPKTFAFWDRDRGLSAGFHLVDCSFRDDGPLYDRVLNTRQRAQLDRLWRDLDYAVNGSEVMLRGTVWFLRAEQGYFLKAERTFRSEDPNLTSDDMIDRIVGQLKQERLGRLRQHKKLQLGPDQLETEVEWIDAFFADIKRGLGAVRAWDAQAERHGLPQVLALASRAFQRPLTAAESQALRALYQQLREAGESIEGALRGTFAAVLASPYFCYRFVPSKGEGDIRTLDAFELAERLSYFLWSSIPDAELMTHAANGTLLEESSLRDQTKRMLRHPRMLRFTREFFGQWLRYRDLAERSQLNVPAFPAYTIKLREAMVEEPSRLARWLLSENRPITELIGGDTTFVNKQLAEHYDVGDRYDEIVRQRRSRSVDKWIRLDGMLALGRGGLLGMGAMLSSNALGKRTSPVKRGFWTVHRLLGVHFPDPPTDIPQLPSEEAKADASGRALLAKHVADPNCAACHRRFDNFGLILERFGPTGRMRDKDLAGRPIDTKVQLPDGTAVADVRGLVAYLQTHRLDAFGRTLCRKLLGYALGRGVQLSDKSLLESMQATLRASNYRLGPVIECIVTSPQFQRFRMRPRNAAGKHATEKDSP